MLPAHPFGSTITIDALRTQFAPLKQQEDILRALIGLAKALPPLDVSLKTPQHEVPATIGCTNLIWFCYEQKHDVFHFLADSETRVIRGLLAILLTQIEGKTKHELQHADLLTLFDELTITPFLSQARRRRLQDLATWIQSIT